MVKDAPPVATSSPNRAAPGPPTLPAKVTLSAGPSAKVRLTALAVPLVVIGPKVAVVSSTVSEPVSTIAPGTDRLE